MSISPFLPRVIFWLVLVFYSFIMLLYYLQNSECFYRILWFLPFIEPSPLKNIFKCAQFKYIKFIWSMFLEDYSWCICFVFHIWMLYKVHFTYHNISWNVYSGSSVPMPPELLELYQLYQQELANRNEKEANYLSELNVMLRVGIL